MRPSSCVTPAGTSNELDAQNEWEENTHTHTHCTVLYCTLIKYVQQSIPQYTVSFSVVHKSVILSFVLCPCMAINVSVQYNGGLLPDITLLT